VPSNRRPHWRDTLLTFLSHSDEDAAYEHFFVKNLSLWLGTLSSPLPELNWLDIGAGPGTKTRRLLSLLCTQFSTINLTAVDSDPIWTNHLSHKHFSSDHVHYSYLQDRFDRYMSIEGNITIRPHFVTSFQVLYDNSLVDDFMCAISNNPQALFVITAECSSSDLAQLRNDILVHMDISCARSFLPDLSHRLALTDRQFAIIPIPDQSLYLTDECIGSANSPGWFLPFLLAISGKQFCGLPKSIRVGLCDLVLGSLSPSFSGIRVLSIPDQALVVLPLGHQVHPPRPRAGATPSF
jgi:hypothetical protein